MMKARIALFSFVALVASAPLSAQVSDPLEGMNRAVFSFNSTVDSWFFKPVAQGYTTVVPSFVRGMVSNFFGNISDVFTIANSALQGKPQKTVDNTVRVIFNTTFGLGGLFDVMGEAGIEKGEEDLGQTLGVWGVGPGPYLVLPLLGPSNLRDAAGSFGQSFADPVSKLSSVPERNTLMSLRAVDGRAGLLEAEGLMSQAALDKYTFLRSAYSQRRQSLVYDGKPPKDE